MFNSSENIVSAIELGTSKIAVIIGRFRSDEEDSLEVIGFGEASSNGAIVKGEIADMEIAFDQLSLALEQADKSSGRRLTESLCTVIPVTGCSIETHHGVGTVPIRGEDGLVTDADCAAADDNASVLKLPPERKQVCHFESYFSIDEGVPIQNPVGHTANKLTAYCLIVSGVGNRLQNFLEIAADSGVETNVFSVFSPAVTDLGILSEDECEHGILLIDLGAGATEYWAEYHSGVLSGGMIPIGFEHVLNDLSLGLRLPISMLRKMAADGSLNRLFQEKPSFWEVPKELGKTRRIPFSSAETIVDARLKELFGLIRGRLEQEKSLSQLSAGGVLTGGGALFCRGVETMRETFDFPVRCGRPQKVSGAATGLDNPRYSTLWGALKQAELYARSGDGQHGRLIGGLLDQVDGAFSKAKRVLYELKASFKV